MTELVKTLQALSNNQKLIMKIQTAPNGELRIEIFAIGTAPHPMEGSDQEIAFAQNKDIEKCAEIALKSLMYWNQRQNP